jgi:hypothetical protein
MKKEALYYVFKYEDKYYSPYASEESFNQVYHTDVSAMLVSDRNLAIRFGDKKIAKLIHKLELDTRRLYGEDSFDPSKCRVVKVVRKDRVFH